MAQLKEIRNRIVSIKNTRQVTSAMKMVSASKLKKAQDQMIKIFPYDQKLQEIINALSLGSIEISSNYFSQPEIKNVLIVVVGSNRGLCGGFNSNVVKFSIVHAFEKYNLQLKSGNVDFLPIGRQVEKLLKAKDLNVVGEAHELLSRLNSENASDLAMSLLEYFNEGRYQRIDIIFNKFKIAAIQILTSEQFLPRTQPHVKEESAILSDFIFEPSKEEILDFIVPQTLRMHLYRILVDSNAAEQGARMVAMHQATENATDLIEELTKEYNNARQAAITNEIVEITAGAEALKV